MRARSCRQPDIRQERSITPRSAWLPQKINLVHSSIDTRRKHCPTLASIVYDPTVTTLSKWSSSETRSKLLRRHRPSSRHCKLDAWCKRWHCFVAARWVRFRNNFYIAPDEEILFNYGLRNKHPSKRRNLRHAQQEVGAIGIVSTCSWSLTFLLTSFRRTGDHTWMKFVASEVWKAWKARRTKPWRVVFHKKSILVYDCVSTYSTPISPWVVVSLTYEKRWTDSIPFD